jgi:hypothetical protein
MDQNYPRLRLELETQVKARTGRRIQNLQVELLPERVILRGLATSYHVKQLAILGIRDILPDMKMDNAIVVA